MYSCSGALKHLQVPDLSQPNITKVQLLKHFTLQYPTFTLDISANGEILHINNAYLFHWFSFHKCLILKGSELNTNEERTYIFYILVKNIRNQIIYLNFLFFIQRKKSGVIGSLGVFPNGCTI